MQWQLPRLVRFKLQDKLAEIFVNLYRLFILQKGTLVDSEMKSSSKLVDKQLWSLSWNSHFYGSS